MSNSFIENSEINQASPTILVHHQIKGAKWGVHRGPPYPLENGIHTKIKRKGAPPVNKEKSGSVKRSSKKPSYSFNINDKVSELSNEELQKRIERFKVTSEYNKYVKEIQDGQKFITKSRKVFREMDAYGKDLYKALKTARDFAVLFGLAEPLKTNDGGKKDQKKG